jgi:aspartate aminotransferase
MGDGFNMAQTKMRPSKRAESLPSSPIRRLAPLAEAARARGLTVLHLNIGQPDLAPPPSVTAALVHASHEPLVYAPSRGLPDVVEAWQSYYRRHGLELETGDILVTFGASEALSLALLATIDVGDEVIVTEPFYAPYTGLVTIAGGVVVPVPLGEGFAPPPIEAIRERISDRTHAIMITSPNNPTGTVYPRDYLLQLAQLARQAGAFLISDETYREIVFDGPAAPSALGLPGYDDEVVVVDSLSKRFSVTGLRIGSLVTRNAAVMAAALQLAELRLSVPVIDQRAAAAELRAGPQYVASVVAAYEERVEAVVSALREIPDVEVYPPTGAFYVVARLPVDDAESFAAWLLSEFSRDGETVMVTPMADFYATPGQGLDQIRVACVYDPERLRRGIALLGAGLASYPGRR